MFFLCIQGVPPFLPGEALHESVLPWARWSLFRVRRFPCVGQGRMRAGRCRFSPRFFSCADAPRSFPFLQAALIFLLVIVRRIFPDGY